MLRFGLLLLGAAAAPCLAQAPDAAAQVAAIERISWMVGEWNGTAVADRGAQGKSEVISWELVDRAAGGTALLVRGRHFRRQPDGTRGDVVHDAAGLITYDARAGKYRFVAQLGNGQHGTFDGSADGAAFLWSLATPQGRIRYRVEPDADGRWQERGEFCPKDAPESACREVFRMSLVRKAAP